MRTPTEYEKTLIVNLPDNWEKDNTPIIFRPQLVSLIKDHFVERQGETIRLTPIGLEWKQMLRLQRGNYGHENTARE